MILYNLLPDDYEDYGIPNPVGTSPTGGLVLDAIIQPNNETTRQIVASAMRYCGSDVNTAAETLAGLAIGSIRERDRDYEVGGKFGYALIGTIPCQGRGENPRLMSALEESLRKCCLVPVYAVFDGEGGVFKSFVEARAARG